VKPLIAILTITIMGILCLSAVALLQAQPTLVASSADSQQRKVHLAYEVKWCCECVRGIGTNKESLGWMQEQRCYMHGGWCGGPRRHCRD
jgi:hypothetical protein